MEVGNRFATMRAVVNHDAESGVEFQFAGEITGGEEEVTKEGLIFRRGFADSCDEFLGDDQHVDGGLRLHVVKGDAEIILVCDLCRDLSVDDFLKNGFRHGDIQNIECGNLE